MDMVDYKHVLLADDDYDDCDFFSEAFHDAFPDIKLSISNDGSKLMEHLNRPPDPLADIIFLDLNMPFKTGPECLMEIRADKFLNSNIVIIFSTSSNTSDIEKMYLMGANYFITKPTNYNELQRLIKKALRLVCENGNCQPLFENFYVHL